MAISERQNVIRESLRNPKTGQIRAGMLELYKNLIRFKYNDSELDIIERNLALAKEHAKQRREEK